MSRSDSCGGDQVCQGLRRHILAPIIRADDVVAAEHEEFQAEIDAFRSFFDRVSELEPTQVTTGSYASRSLYDADSIDTSQRLRTAYQKTVLSMEHFERVYDESLAENVAAELSPQLVTVFEPGGNAFTDVYRQGLREAVQDAIVRREQFVSVLEDEARSVDTARSQLKRILNSGDRSGRPTTPAGDRLERLNDVAEERQEVLRSRPSLFQLDGHEFCEYVYKSEQWTYPVLAAVARLCENVVE